MKFNFTSITLVFLGASVYSKAHATIELFGVEFDVLAYGFFILYFAVALVTGKLKYSRWLLIAYAYFLVSLCLALIFSNPSIMLFLKQFVPISILSLAAYTIISKVGVKRAFETYCDITFYVAIFGVLQFALYFADVQLLSEYKYRLVSVTREPSHYGVAAMPALVYSYINLYRLRIKFVVMGIAMLLTGSLSSYLTALVIYLIYSGTSILLIPALVIVYFAFDYLVSIPDYKFRIYGVLQYFKTGSFYNLHGTPLSVLSNLEVAIESLKSNFLTGVSLGNHETLYNEYFSKNSFSNYSYQIGLNSKSAHSLSIRILCELGLLGFLGYIVSLYKLTLFRRPLVDSGISLACLSHFVGKTMKLGGYFDMGTIFFVIVMLVSFEERVPVGRLKEMWRNRRIVANWRPSVPNGKHRSF